MNADLTKLRTLVLKDLDPKYYHMNAQQVEDWLRELPKIESNILAILQEEVLGDMDNSLVERHLKQINYDCVFLLNALYKYGNMPDVPEPLYFLTESCLQNTLTHIEGRYGSFFLRKEGDYHQVGEDYRIRVLLSAGGLAYFFKLLFKAGALDSGPVSRMMVSLSKNFTTSGIGNGSLSSYSLMTKYKQVVQSTAKSIRALLVKMLRILDEEFTIV
ncbi:hypothetical protein ABDJ41_14100 [Pedobacter sp. ASV1-7]|uniref:hypothetical protein n=1 Tax=Pedobacter sp. ASV1-7 TaxID=3145237 RepID=UPI0032E857EF